jgi:vancomycin resistance protein YoaR
MRKKVDKKKKSLNIQNKNDKRNRLISFFIVVASALFFSGVFAAGSLIVINRDSIHDGIYVENVDVGGLSIIEAADKIETVLNKTEGKEKLRLRYRDKIWKFTADELSLQYDLLKAANEAFLIGRRGNYLNRFATVIELLKDPRNISLKPSVDMEKLDAILNSISKEINRPAKEAQVERRDGKFIIRDEVLGLKLDKEKTIERIQEAFMNSGYKDIVEINLMVKTASPKYTSKMLSYIRDLLGSYTTKFNSAIKGRSYNIALSSKAINGTVLLPNEIFSFNEIVGPRTVNNGYKTAPVIFRGELVDGIGGGVCQVSSTIYNSVLKSRLGIVERVNHSIPSTYVPMGLDATVSYGVLDFKFKNTTDYPIYIESFVKGNELTVNIYGHETKKQDVKVMSKVNDVIEKDTEIIFDSNMYEDEKVVKDKGRNGYRVSSYMIIYENGREVERKLLSKDYYPPSKQIIIKGTKKRIEKSKIENRNKMQDVKGYIIQ